MFPYRGSYFCFHRFARLVRAALLLVLCLLFAPAANVAGQDEPTNQTDAETAPLTIFLPNVAKEASLATPAATLETPVTATITPTGSLLVTNTPTPTETPSPTATPTNTPTATPTFTPSPTSTPVNPPTPTLPPSLAPGLLVDQVWHWGDINLAPGSRGIRVVDWDEDTHNEILMAHEQLIFAIQHTSEYRFAQEWSVPSGAAWGVDDLTGDKRRELWVLKDDGQLLAYQPHQYQPLILGRLFAQGSAAVSDAQVVDLLGDGQVALVVLQNSSSQWSVHRYRLPDFQETWHFALGMRDSFFSPIMRIDQMDADPARELAFDFGIVVDPTKPQAEWTYNDGFGRPLAVGDIDNDGQAEIVGANSAVLTAFDVDVKTPQWQITQGNAIQALALVNVNGDAALEVLVGDDQWGEVRVYDAATRQQLWVVDNPEHGVSGIGVGDADNDGELDLIWGAGWTSSGVDHLYLAPVSRRKPQFTFFDYDGPYSAVATQMDIDDAQEIIIFTGATNSNYDASSYFIIDSATGQDEIELTLQIDKPLSGGSGQFTPLLVNVDSDPNDELVLRVGDLLYLLESNGSQLLKRQFTTTHVPKWAGDLDNDGVQELVTINGNQVTVFTLATLEIEWQSIAFPAGVEGLAVGDVDQDGRLELVFHGLHSYLQAYDGVTKKLDWQMPAGQDVRGVAIGNIDNAGAMELIAAENQQIKVYNAKTRQLITTTFTLNPSTFPPVQLGLTQIISTPYPQLVVADGGSLSLFKKPLDVTPTQTITLPTHNFQWGDVDNDQHRDLLLGGALGVGRYRARETFPDRTAPLARAVTPAANADLVSRNAFIEARFNEAMNPATINASTIQLHVNNAPLASSLSYEATTRVVRITPQGLLPPNSIIAVLLGPGLQDLAGNGLDGNFNGVGGETGDLYRWQFTTGNGIDQVGPAISNLLLTPNPAWAGMQISLTATVDDTQPDAASTIRRVEYFLDTPGAPGTGILLNAVDKNYDERQEQSIAHLDSTGWTGLRAIYVAAEDSVGNWSAPVVANLTLQPESPANWPMFGHNPAHTGYNAAQGKVTTQSQAWEINVWNLFGATNARPPGQVAVVNGLAVVNGDSYFGNGGILALDASSGAERWRRTFQGKYSINPASIAYGQVYFQQGNHGSDTHLFALNALTGDETWKAPFGAQWEEYFAPTVANSQVFINGGHYGGLYAFNAFTGDQLWFADIGQYDHWTPSYRQGVVYSWVAGTFAAWQPNFGTQLWSTGLGWNWAGYDMERIAVISDTLAFVTINGDATNGALVAVNLATQAERWRLTGAYIGTPALADGILYALKGNVLEAYNAATGDLLDSFTATAPLVGAPLITAGNVYVAATDKTWLLDRATLDSVWMLDKGGWLTVANNQLFIAQPTGVLTAYNLQ